MRVLTAEVPIEPHHIWKAGPLWKRTWVTCGQSDWHEHHLIYKKPDHQVVGLTIMQLRCPGREPLSQWLIECIVQVEAFCKFHRSLIDAIQSKENDWGLNIQACGWPCGSLRWKLYVGRGFWLEMSSVLQALMGSLDCLLLVALIFGQTSGAAHPCSRGPSLWASVGTSFDTGIKPIELLEERTPCWASPLT